MSRHVKKFQQSLICVLSIAARNNKPCWSGRGCDTLRNRSTQSLHRQCLLISNNSLSRPLRTLPLSPCASRCSTCYYGTAKSTAASTSSKSTKRRTSKASSYSDPIEQGLVVTDDSRADVDALAELAESNKVDKIYPTVLHDAKVNMERLPNCVLLTRVGSFYEVHWLLLLLAESKNSNLDS
jgi:hypothetical protein